MLKCSLISHFQRVKVNHTQPEQDKQYLHQKAAKTGISSSQLDHLAMLFMPANKSRQLRGRIMRIQNLPSDNLPGNHGWINPLASEPGGKPCRVPDKKGVAKANTLVIVIDQTGPDFFQIERQVLLLAPDEELPFELSGRTAARASIGSYRA